MLPLLTLALCLGLGARGIVRAEVTRSLRVSGLSAIIDQDLGSAFEQAKRAALRQAVEEAVGTLVSAHTRVQNLTLIDDAILTRTAGFVSRFEIVERGPVDEHTYKVVLDAVVDLGRVHAGLEALDLLRDEVGDPRLLCLGRERLVLEGGEESVSWGMVAAELVEVLRKTSPNLRIVEPGPALGAGGGPDEVAALGRRQQADFALWGDAVVQPAAIKIPFAPSPLGDVGLHSVVVRLRLRALWTDSGEVLFELSRTQKAAGATLRAAAAGAIHQGVAHLADSLSALVAADWRRRVYSGRTIHLTVRGSPEQLRLFERRLAARAGSIQKLYPRRYEQGTAVYDARSQYAAFHLARQLSARGLEGLDVEILQASPNALELQLSNRAPVAGGGR